MPLRHHQLTIGDLVVDVFRKKIKNLNLTVRPPDGRVRISVPLHVDDEAVRLVIASRLDWIRRHQARIAAQESYTTREYITGEGHFFMGDLYRLTVIERDAPPEVVLHSGNHLDLFVRSGSDTSRREQVLKGWYRDQLEAMLPAIAVKWEAAIGVHASKYRIRQMKSRWGSCNTNQQRIVLNLELAKRPPRSLEYVVVHELVHLLERRHGKRFQSLMDRYLPHWRTLRAELSALSPHPLTDE